MSEGGWMCSIASVMPGLTRHLVLLMADGEQEGMDMDEAAFVDWSGAPGPQRSERRG